MQDDLAKDRFFEERYRLLFEQANDAILVENEDDEILDANPRACQLFGYTREELLTLRVPDLLAPEARQRRESVVTADLARPGAAAFESLDLRKDGTTFPIEVSLSRLGESGLVFAIVRDITERKRAEEALRRSETSAQALDERYRALFEHANDAIFVESDQDEILDVNQRACDLLGYTREELLALKISDIQAPEVAGTPGSVIRSELSRYQGHIFESIDMRKDGTRIPVEVSLSHLGDSGVNFTIVRDISERKMAERILREREERLRISEERLRLITENMVDTISMIDAEQRFVYVSPSYRRVYGWQPAALIGQSALSWIHPDDANRVRGNMRSAIAEHSPTALLEYAFLCADGAYLWIESNVRILYDDQGAFDGAIFGSRDITKRKQAEEARVQQLARLEALREIDKTMASSLDLRVTLSILLSKVTGLLGVDAAAVLLYDPVTQTLNFVQGRGFYTNEIERAHVLLGQSYAGKVALNRKHIWVDPLPKMSLPQAGPLFQAERFVTYIGLPLVSKSQVKGVLEVFHRSSLKPEPGWFDYLEILAGQAAIAVDNIQLFENLQRANADLEMAYNTTLVGWSRALDLRDQETEGHSQRVTDLTLRLAREMGLPAEQLLGIYRGALLHDIGKMGIPDEILLKPEALSPMEWEIMRQHPAIAFDLLSPVPFLQSALDIPYCHHEKWDGSGYPRGLMGLQIPLAARIFAVADVWDAILSDRPYRPARTREEAVTYLRDQAGRHFDPQVVEAFLILMGAGEA